MEAVGVAAVVTKPASVFERIETLLGPEATTLLLDCLGGRKIYIRVHPAVDDGDAITDAVGLENSRLLSLNFGGVFVELPVAEALAWRRRAAERVSRIFELSEQGRNPHEIATELRCSSRWVRRILNGK